MRYQFLLLFIAISSVLAAQDNAKVYGRVSDKLSLLPIDYATVYIEGMNISAETDKGGNFSLEVPVKTDMILKVSRIGYQPAELKISSMKHRQLRKVNVLLAPMESDFDIIVTESKIEDMGMVREKVEEFQTLPTTTGNFESVLPHIALGASGGTGGELSSQYNVRGGNYDENLVYVNDFEIYRPQLVRAGQQEGLTFPNINLIRDLSFSSGGFESKYGDKLSSVLDIRYKRPDSLRGSVNVSALGAGAHIEGSVRPLENSGPLRFLAGVRYKTTRYLLGTLDTEGEYLPSFVDMQTYLTYDLPNHWQIGWLSNYNKSIYNFTPLERNTAFGTTDFALKLNSRFQGNEVDDFSLYFNGISATYIPDRSYNPIFLKFMASNFVGHENEAFDIIGTYGLYQIETAPGDSQGEEVALWGNGQQHQYVRNYLVSSVSNFEHKGGFEWQVGEEVDRTHFFQWGAKYQNEYIFDRINEWERLDSAGFSLPYDTSGVRLFNTYKSENELSTHRVSAYFQDTYTATTDRFEMKASLGVRASYWSANEELVLSPRLQVLLKPAKWDEDISFKLATGLYHQPPFYREMRKVDGALNLGLNAQKSAHFLGGISYDFDWKQVSNKKFKLIAEVYYKHLWDLVTYDIDNVRIRYSGENDATGYVFGFDARVNGEFVPGAESWFNISFLRARERIDDIRHLQREFGESEAKEVDNVSRPSDQLMSMSVFFQDYLPRNENFKMHLNFTVGTGLPYGLPGNNTVYRNTYRYDVYHRVDIGFSIQLWEDAWKKRKPSHFLKFTRSTWLSLEIFNLMKIQNEASKTWIKSIYGVQFAIPNYLTSRRINLRLKMDF
jgi:hypothetical protein